MVFGDKPEDYIAPQIASYQLKLRSSLSYRETRVYIDSRR